MDARVKPAHECVRESVLSAWWESVPCEITAYVAEGNCVAEGRSICVAPRRGGEQPEANGQPVGTRTRFGGVLRRASSCLEAKPGAERPIERTGVIRKRDVRAHGVVGDWMSGRQADGPERAVVLARHGRGQSPHSTAAGLSCEKRGQQSRAEGRWAGRWMQDDWMGASESIGSARKGYTRCRSPRLVVDGSFGLDGTHGVGAGERRQRRTLV